jgi:DNA-binding transcriptional regulator YhcF (GntR family)
METVNAKVARQILNKKTGVITFDDCRFRGYHLVSVEDRMYTLERAYSDDVLDLFNFKNFNQMRNTIEILRYMMVEGREFFTVKAFQTNSQMTEAATQKVLDRLEEEGIVSQSSGTVFIRKFSDSSWDNEAISSKEYAEIKKYERDRLRSRGVWETQKDEGKVHKAVKRRYGYDWTETTAYTLTGNYMQEVLELTKRLCDRTNYDKLNEGQKAFVNMVVTGEREVIMSAAAGYG